MSESFDYDLCVIGGCGRAGLPIAMSFARTGKKVVSVDINEDVVRQVASGTMPFLEEGGEKLLREVIDSGRFEAVTSPEVVSRCENIILILGTPVSTHLYPKYSEFFRIIESYLPFFRNGQVIILRSTVYPGCSEKVYKLLQDKGLDIDVAFCPERIAEGFSLRELRELPQIVSGFSASAENRARELFSVLTKDIVELAPMEAELAKLFSNVWRYIKFSIPNQFYIIANSHGLDFYKIHRAMTYKEPRTQDLPKAGFTAGPCLFKDTMQLAAFTDNSLFLGHAAMLVNERMPTYIVDCLRKRFELEKKVVGILGVAFKSESDDTRESLAFKLWNSLEKECRKVIATDPYVKDERLSPLEDVMRQSDVLILAAPHRIYADLDLKGKEIADIWDFWGRGGVV